MSRGYLTIEAALVTLVLLMGLELLLLTQQQAPESLYRFIEGDVSCDINCLLEAD